MKLARGFTLIEILVVVAIIGVLAALSYPILTKALGGADLAASQSAMKTLGTAIFTYAADHDGALPYCYYAQQFVVKEKHLSGRDLLYNLAPYLDAESLGPLEYVPGTASRAFLKNYKPAETAAYYMNPSVQDGNGNYFPPFGYRLTQPVKKLITIPSPSRQVAMIDLDSQLPGPTGVPIGGTGMPLTPIHKDRRAALFFDGHIEIVPDDKNFYIDQLW